MQLLEELFHTIRALSDESPWDFANGVAQAGDAVADFRLRDAHERTAGKGHRPRGQDVDVSTILRLSKSPNRRLQQRTRDALKMWLAAHCLPSPQEAYALSYYADAVDAVDYEVRARRRRPLFSARSAIVVDPAAGTFSKLVQLGAAADLYLRIRCLDHGAVIPLCDGCPHSIVTSAEEALGRLAEFEGHPAFQPLFIRFAFTIIWARINAVSPMHWIERRSGILQQLEDYDAPILGVLAKILAEDLLKEQCSPQHLRLALLLLMTGAVFGLPDYTGIAHFWLNRAERTIWASQSLVRNLLRLCHYREADYLLTVQDEWESHELARLRLFWIINELPAMASPNFLRPRAPKKMDHL